MQVDDQKSEVYEAFADDHSVELEEENNGQNQEVQTAMPGE